MSELRVWAERALTPERELHRVRLLARDARVSALEVGVAPAPDDVVFEGATLVPGLVDLQVNGGAGAAYDADRPTRERATRFHLERGTTSLLATLVSAPLERIESALRELDSDVRAGGPVVGVHLEGPFLAAEKSGAHASPTLCDPTLERVDAILRAAGGSLRLVTLAPERDGALAAVERFAAAGVVVAAGHSRASLRELRDAIERGLSFVTHVGNASDWPSRPLDPERGFRVSEPGVVGAFLVEPRLRGSVIADGYHLHPELIRALVELRGPDAVVLVSDATPAAGLAPGRYELGGLSATLHPEGYATAGEGLAGSTIALVDAVRSATHDSGLPLATAVQMATRTPARILGLDGRGSIEPGCAADLVLLDRDLRPTAVYRDGCRV